jgi:hypothetical protein
MQSTKYTDRSSPTHLYTQRLCLVPLHILSSRYSSVYIQYGECGNCSILTLEPHVQNERRPHSEMIGSNTLKQGSVAVSGWAMRRTRPDRLPGPFFFVKILLPEVPDGSPLVNLDLPFFL